MRNAEGPESLGVPGPSRPTTEAIEGVSKAAYLLRRKITMKRTQQEAKQAVVAYRNLNRAEVEWYRSHGRHADRVRVDGHGVKYVVGDWSWNRNHPDRREHIEDAMPRPKIEEHLCQKKKAQ